MTARLACHKFAATLLRDRRGVAAARFALFTCLFAAAVALTVPRLLSKDIAADPVIELRHHLPEALEAIGNAMKG
ncbi:hypothetical protein [Rhizorhabdus sp. FW153]|uniref:hypothetical protein n=1 Tax=Rhizorhabdus sp. FW153 TaxID=3400216 RepID=UPI003CF21AC6